jgi:hypothetical protein
MARSPIDWNIRRQGRAWSREEVRQRYDSTPEKFELIDGKLFWSEEDRINLLGLLLENVGIDKAIRLGDPAIWREAIADLGETR